MIDTDFDLEEKIIEEIREVFAIKVYLDNEELIGEITKISKYLNRISCFVLYKRIKEEYDSYYNIMTSVEKENYKKLVMFLSCLLDI